MIATLPLALVVVAANPDFTVEASLPSLSLGNQVGLNSNGGGELDLGVGATVIGQYQHFELGVIGDASAALIAEEHTHVGVLVGGALDFDRSRFELLLEGGEHWLTGIGTQFLNSSTGNTNAQLPYAGLRFGYTRRRPSRDGVVFGLWVYARYDLQQTTQAVATTSCDFEWGCSRNPETAHVGGGELGVAFRIGFDVAPHFDTKN
jgi:hypothetical protein